MLARKSNSHPYVEFDGPMLFAHRGGARLGPENTLAAFDQGLAMGADALELDIWPTREGEPVVIHDGTADRTTDGTGRIPDLPLEVLQTFDAGFRFTPDEGKTFPFRGRGIRVPALEEVFSRYPGVRVNIEVKGTSPRLESRLEELLERHGRWEKTLVCSAEGRLNLALRKRFPTVAHGASAGEVAWFWGASKMGLGRLAVPDAHALQIPPFHRGIPVLTPRLVEAAHASGLKVHVWTIDEESEMKTYLDWGVDGLMSDRPDRLTRVRDQFVTQGRKAGL